ncbi:hypothetical protein Aperf_G00000099737 [Anoplocephala perfoliata]
MGESPPVCSGGIVEYITYYADNLTWRSTSVNCFLSQTDLILLLCILCLSLAVLCIFLLSELCIFRHRRRFSFHHSSPAPPLFSPESDGLHRGMTLLSGIVKPIQQSFVVHLRTYLSSNINTSITNASTNLSTVIESMRLLKIPIDGTDSTDTSPSTLSAPNRIYSINLLYVGLTISVLVAIMIGTIYTCVLARTIESTVCGLTNHIGEVSLASKELANTFISEAYAIMNRVIKMDVAQNNHRSNLRPFVEEMKLIWGDEAMRLYAMALNITPTKQWLREHTRANLLHFNTFLRRLSSLFSVAPFLSEGNIKSVNDVFLSYTYELARLTPHPLFRSASWRDVKVLNFTAVALCEHSTSFFPTCSDVESHLEMITTELDTWPRYEKNRDFTKVTAFSLLPRMLNAEAYVERWLPLAQDPTGNIPFLFDEFLIAEIDKERARLNRTLDILQNKFAESSARKYLNIASVLPVTLAIMLPLLLILSLTAVLVSPSCCCFCVIQPNRISKAGRGGKFAICYRQFFAISTTLLCVIGVGFGIAGSIGQSQLCDVLFVRSQHADVWLNHLLAKVFSRLPGLHEVFEIDNIHIRIPERVFSTLDTNYTPGSPPFLQSINMNRPVNLRALWHSQWLNKTLYELWYKEVWPLMERANLSYRVPRVPFSKTFNQFRIAVKLDQTFDNLYVGNVGEYLPEPATDYYTRIALALKAKSNHISKEVDQLANYFTAIGDLIALYKLKLEQIAQALKVIENNKMVLEPLSPLIDVSDKIISYLANKTDTELISQFTNNTANIFVNSKIPVERYVLPVAHQVLDQLFPYPHLRETYRKALSPICPTEFTYSALFLTLRSFGFTLSLSAFGLFVVGLGCNRVLLREHNSAS